MKSTLHKEKNETSGSIDTKHHFDLLKSGKIWFTTGEVADYAGVAIKTIHNWVHTGKIKSNKRNSGSKYGRSLIHRRELLKIIKD